MRDQIVEMLILKALRENPQGLTEKQIYKYVKKNLKKLKKAIDILM